MSVINLENKNFDDEIKSGVVLVDFFANWCGPCKMLSPVIEGLSNELNDVKFIKLNVDEHGELASRYQIMSIPALILFKDGKVVSKAVGFQPKDALKTWINQNK